jgi:hypothetical protein
MLRILFGGLALLLFVPAAFACDGQTGNVIFEDKFTDDSGVWIFGGALILTAPGATAMAPASDIGAAQTSLNQTFNATQGDFCMEMSYPPDAAQLNAGIGVLFWGTDASNYWSANPYANGSVNLVKLAFKHLSPFVETPKRSLIFETTTNNLVKTGPTDVNSIRVVVKNGTITVIVNGQTIKSVRAQIPGGDLKFGFTRSYRSPSATPVSFTVHSYKVTDVE